MNCHTVVIVVALFVSETFGKDATHETVLNDTKAQFLQDFEVPDSALLLIDRVKLRTVPTLRRYTRPKQGQGSNSTNITTSTPPSSSTSSSSSRPCNCTLGVCKCCTGPVLDLFGQKACMRVTYHPGDFAFDVAMSWNDYILYENSMSGRNPRPICVSPPRIRNLKLCAKFYDVFFPGRNFHFCLAMSGKWQSFELFNMAFDCLRMGADGVVMMRPEENGGITIPNPQGGVDAVIDSGDDIEDYDENVVKSFLDIFDRK